MEILIVIVLAAVAVVVVWRLRGSLEGTPGKVTRAIAAAEPTAVAALAPGTAQRVDGIARPVAPPSPSPATGRPCVAYDVWISAFPGDSPSRRSAQAAVDFLVEDDTGTVLVRAAGAAVAIERDTSAPTTTLDQVPFADQVLRAQGVSIGSPTTCRVEMVEGVLGPGDPVSVLGHVEAPDADALALGAAFVLCTTPDRPVLIARGASSPDPA